MKSWEDFQRTRFALDPAALVDQPTRQRLEALPGMVRIRGDAAPLDYELQDGEGVARVRLREGQAKRLRADELPGRSTGRSGSRCSGAAIRRSWPIPFPPCRRCCSGRRSREWKEDAGDRRGGGRRGRTKHGRSVATRPEALRSARYDPLCTLAPMAP